MIDGGAAAGVNTTNFGAVSQKWEASTPVSTFVSPPTRVKGAATGAPSQIPHSNTSPHPITSTAAIKPTHKAANFVPAHRSFFFFFFFFFLFFFFRDLPSVATVVLAVTAEPPAAVIARLLIRFTANLAFTNPIHHASELHLGYGGPSLGATAQGSLDRSTSAAITASVPIRQVDQLLVQWPSDG